MRNITLLFSVLFFFCSYTMLSQDTVNKEIQCVPGTEEYAARYTKLKDMYETMLKSEKSLHYMALVRDYVAKANYDKRNWREEETTMNDWVLNNIEKTDFKDCAEAEAANAKILDENLMIMQDHEELYNYLSESLEICPDITSNLIRELTREYGADFRF